MTWSETTSAQKVELVRDLVQHQGLTYRAAALVLGTTRTAVAGVADRAKDKGAPIRAERKAPVHNKVGSDGGKAVTARAKVVRARQRAFDGPVVPRTAPELLASDAWTALPGSAPAPIAEHVNGCRWPIGGDLPFLYCNEPLRGGSPYCSRHHAIAFREVPMRREIRKEDR